jgi:predicted nucleic acid-binding Zn ribbon protein
MTTRRRSGEAEGRTRRPTGRRTDRPTAAPTPIGEAIKAYTAKSGLARRIDLAQAVEDWAERVGTQIAAVTRAESVTPDGVLRVRVPSAAWANELSLMTPKILAKMNAGRRGRIRELRFITGPLDR